MTPPPIEWPMTASEHRSDQPGDGHDHGADRPAGPRPSCRAVPVSRAASGRAKSPRTLAVAVRLAGIGNLLVDLHGCEAVGADGSGVRPIAPGGGTGFGDREGGVRAVGGPRADAGCPSAMSPRVSASGCREPSRVPLLTYYREARSESIPCKRFDEKVRLAECGVNNVRQANAVPPPGSKPHGFGQCLRPGRSSPGFRGYVPVQWKDVRSSR